MTGKRFSFSILPSAILAFSLPSTVHAVEFDWSIVGNPANGADSADGDRTTPGTQHFGSVSYQYRISKYEVTNAQYVEFLNAVAAIGDPNNLYRADMSGPFGGITRTCSPGGCTYAVKPDAVGMGPNGSDYSYANKPVNFVSYFDVMRFVNWLENGQPTGSQDATTTEEGVYNVVDGVHETRKPGSKYFVPTENEWYKAAYHKNDGITSNYWRYITASDRVPNNKLPPADTGNSANFNLATGDAFFPFTDVGAYADTKSPYGTFDQGGNVSEWNESLYTNSLWHIIRGGGAEDISINLASIARSSAEPTREERGIGFRVASHIPEPSSGFIALAGFCSAIGWRRFSVDRFRGRQVFDGIC
jgi:formylglycine-generating enzyme required for sulfatase activity